MTLQDLVDALKREPENVRKAVLVGDDGKEVMSIAVKVAARNGVTIEMNTNATE